MSAQNITEQEEACLNRFEIRDSDKYFATYPYDDLYPIAINATMRNSLNHRMLWRRATCCRAVFEVNYWIAEGYFSLDDAMSSRPGVDISRITEVRPLEEMKTKVGAHLNSDGWPRWRGWMDLFPRWHHLKGNLNFKVTMNVHHCGEGCNR